MKVEASEIELPVFFDCVGSAVFQPTVEKIAGILESYEGKEKLLLGCYLADRLVGVLGLSGELKNVIEYIGVSPSRRGQGIGRGLVRFAVQEVGTCLEAETDESAVGFYRSVGFQAVSFERRYGDTVVTRYRCTLD